MSKYQNDNVGLTAWALDAYKNLSIIAMTAPMDAEARQLVEDFLADAPEFFEPHARKYADERIVRGIRKVRGMFGL